MSQRLKLSDGAYVGAMMATFVVLGALGGLIWRLWSHAPSGMVIGHDWIPGAVQISGSLYPLAQPPQAIPAATAHWAILAAVVGLIGGLAAALAGRGREYASLAATLIGSACGAVVMLGVGLIGRGIDPQELAQVAPDGTMVPGRLSLAEPWLLGIPVAVAGTVLAVAFLGWVARPSSEVPENVGG